MLCCLGRQSIPALETVACSGNAPKADFSVNHGGLSTIRHGMAVETAA
jgi:hypothetical protein